MTGISRRIQDGLRAAIPAAVLSGLPSTLHSLATRRDPLEASVAAGSLLLPKETRRGRLVIAAIPVHLALSAFWSAVVATVAPRKRPGLEGIVAGLCIAAIDLGFVGRHYPRIRALQPAPQLADHLAFGLLVTISLERQTQRDRERGRTPRTPASTFSTAT